MEVSGIKIIFCLGKATSCFRVSSFCNGYMGGFQGFVLLPIIELDQAFFEKVNFIVQSFQTRGCLQGTLLSPC